MKSPWRFLSGLTSRRKPDQAPLQLPAPNQENIVEEDKRELENATAPAVSAVTPIIASEETAEAVATTDEQSLPAAIESVKETGKTEPTSSPEFPGEAEPSTASLPKAETPLTAEIEPERPDDAASSETGVTLAKRVKPAKGRTTAPTTTVAVDVAKTNLPAAQPLDFFGEASALDAEITELKLALAQKLKQQNAQLKKMLARFDVG
jgi:hypothetical protein